jgi:hypothetical protein
VEVIRVAIMHNSSVATIRSVSVGMSFLSQASSGHNESSNS